MEVVLGMAFLTFHNLGVQFAKKKLTWRTYIIEEALLTICWFKLIDWKKFAKAALDQNIKAFVVYVSFLGPRMTIPLAKET